MSTYYCVERPPSPGAIPRDVTEITPIDRVMEDAGGHARYVYASIEYERELTEQEISDYELEVDMWEITM